MTAVKAYARANRLDRVTVPGGANPRFGIVSTGKAYMDVLQGLADLGIDHQMAEQLGLSVYKVGMSWPLDPAGLTEFAAPLEKMLVVEEKRGLIEPQIKETLYGLDGAPVIIGKRGIDGTRLLPEEGSVNATQVAYIIATELLAEVTLAPPVAANLDQIKTQLDRDMGALAMARTPYFCAGCPHNSQLCCLKVRVVMPVLAVTGWPSLWTAMLKAIPIWAGKGPTGLARRVFYPLPCVPEYRRWYL